MTGGGSVNSSNNGENSPSEAARLEAWNKFKSAIGRYARTNDRRMMIRALKDCPRLRIIPMDLIETFPTTPEQWLQCEKEVSRTNVRINGTPMMGFAGSASSANRHKKTSGGKDHVEKGNQELLDVLKKLCDHLTSSDASTAPGQAGKATVSAATTISSEALYHEILLRLVRTTASADAYFQLNALLGCGDLVVQLPKKAAPLPTDLSLYAASDGSGMVHAVAVTRHPYGVFRKTDMAGSCASPSVSSCSTGGKRPWVRLIAEVHERVNLTTGDSVRYCSVKVQDKL